MHHKVLGKNVEKNPKNKHQNIMQTIVIVIIIRI